MQSLGHLGRADHWLKAQKLSYVYIYIYNIFMFYTHILSKIMHSPNYIYTPNNSRSGPVSGDNSNKQIFILHIFRGNKQIDYRRVRQLSNPLVCRQGRKSAYYPPVTIYYIYIYVCNKNDSIVYQFQRLRFLLCSLRQWTTLVI